VRVVSLFDFYHRLSFNPHPCPTGQRLFWSINNSARPVNIYLMGVVIGLVGLDRENRFVITMLTVMLYFMLVHMDYGFHFSAFFRAFKIFIAPYLGSYSLAIFSQPCSSLASVFSSSKYSIAFSNLLSPTATADSLPNH